MVTPKGMAHAFKIKFWETFNIPGYYDILTDGQYKMPNSNDGCMWLRAPTACPKWNEGTDEDVKVLQWLSEHVGLTSECISEVIKPFSKQKLENAINGMMWNKAAKCAATRQVVKYHISYFLDIYAMHICLYLRYICIVYIYLL